jgi:hypothetical protein
MPEDRQYGAFVKGKDKEQILAELGGTAVPGTQIHELQKSALMVRCTQDLEKQIVLLTATISDANHQQGRLNKRLFYLNIVLTVATMVGAFAILLAALRHQ